MKSGRGAVLLAAALLLPVLFARGLWPPDETRYADVARAMLTSGDWVVPQLHGAVYGEKPPVFFWAIAAVSALGAPLGVAPRLVSVLASLATLALLPGIATALRLGPERGARGALVLATAPLFWVYAQLGLLDATSTALVTAAIAAKLARHDRRGVARASLIAAEGVALGAALLTKGPVLLLFPLGLRIGALVGRREAGATAPASASARPDASDLLALGVGLALGGAWIAAAFADAGAGYVRAITLGQALRRVTGDAPHLRPPGFLLAVTLLGLLPWTLLGVGSLRRERLLARPTPAVGALLGWGVLPLALLSLLATQQPHYGLPGLPALALLLAGPLLTPPRGVVRGLAAVTLGAALALATIGLATPQLAAAAGLDPVLVARLGDDVLLRGSALLAALLLAACVLARAPAGSGGPDGPGASAVLPWQRALAATALLLGVATLALARIDPIVVPRTLFERPEIAGAERLQAPSSLRSAIRVATGRENVSVLEEEFVVERLLRDPDLVALVWQRDLPRIAAPPGTLEEIARDFANGRVVVALRGARASPPPVSP